MLRVPQSTVDGDGSGGSGGGVALVIGCGWGMVNVSNGNGCFTFTDGCCVATAVLAAGLLYCGVGGGGNGLDGGLFLDDGL